MWARRGTLEGNYLGGAYAPFGCRDYTPDRAWCNWHLQTPGCLRGAIILGRLAGTSSVFGASTAWKSELNHGAKCRFKGLKKGLQNRRRESDSHLTSLETLRRRRESWRGWGKLNAWISEGLIRSVCRRRAGARMSCRIPATIGRLLPKSQSVHLERSESRACEIGPPKARQIHKN